MANPIVYPGSSSFFPGDTPFGFFDNDYQFQIDADKVANFVAKRLGYGITEVELTDEQFYTAFEEATIKYGNELYAYKLRDNLLNLEGTPTSSNLNQALINPSLQNIIRITQQYGVEDGVGGNVNWFSGSFLLPAGTQDFDLSNWAATQSITGGIEIKRVFYYGPPAVTRFYDPYAGTGLGAQNLMDSFGFGAYSPSVNFVIMPVNYDMQVIQAIEFNDQVRKSAYSFELINGKIRIFPLPSQDTTVWFQYIKFDDRLNSIITQKPGAVTNVSNANYSNITYSQINSIGRAWIFEYTLAICKETLGLIRGKYQQLPVPGQSITLNQNDLTVQATKDKTDLVERLRAYFDETSRQSLLSRKKEEDDSITSALNKNPLQIYIG